MQLSMIIDKRYNDTHVMDDEASHLLPTPIYARCIALDEPAAFAAPSPIFCRFSVVLHVVAALHDSIVACTASLSNLYFILPTVPS